MPRDAFGNIIPGQLGRHNGVRRDAAIPADGLPIRVPHSQPGRHPRLTGRQQRHRMPHRRSPPASRWPSAPHRRPQHRLSVSQACGKALPVTGADLAQQAAAASRSMQAARAGAQPLDMPPSSGIAAGSQAASGWPAAGGTGHRDYPLTRLYPSRSYYKYSMRLAGRFTARVNASTSPVPPKPPGYSMAGQRGETRAIV